MTASSSYTPVTKMPEPQRTASTDSASDGVRKRVCKACDRCRLKKSKCDGSHPCSRCKADNAICVFGERKKSHDKVYPKGYVEMLEQQQSQLVAGLQEMYKRLLAANAWKGSTLAEANGHPLTHDILAALDLLETKHDGSGEVEAFEEDCSRLQSRLIAEGAGFTQRRGSLSSDSENSQQGNHARSMSQNTPTFSKPPVFRESFQFSAPPSPPSNQSPVPGVQHRQSFPPQHSSPLSSDPQFYQAEWAYPDPSNSDPLMRSKYALHSSTMENGLPSFGSWEPTSTTTYDVKYDMNNVAGFASYSHQHIPTTLEGMSRMQDTSAAGMTMDAMMDVEFNQFIQVTS